QVRSHPRCRPAQLLRAPRCSPPPPSSSAGAASASGTPIERTVGARSTGTITRSAAATAWTTRPSHTTSTTRSRGGKKRGEELLEPGRKVATPEDHHVQD
ncbi:MAG: DUF3682 domain-containing protein, partial [Nitrososphaerota archaeon]|nr:DUF3682 domain-containing protein [Nitrososphaerota archaeon]